MGWLFFKKVKKTPEILEVEDFNRKLKELLALDDYISVKEYSFLTEQFFEAEKALRTINESGLLSIYCQKNRIKPVLITNFLSDYLDLKNIISGHNKQFIETALIKDKKYLLKILEKV